jgi:selenocysteine lyase/cysteine desulfurase
VGRADWLEEARPYLAGGGAVRRVTLSDVEWTDGAARHEAGTPNVIGAAAMGAACRYLTRIGMARVAWHEKELLEIAAEGIARIPGVRILSMWGPASPRLGIVSFTVKTWDSGALAAALSAEYGIGVRAGAFCAHPLVAALVGAGERQSAVRVSFGIGTSGADIDRLLAALAELCTRGPEWRYRVDNGRHVPDPDPRPRPFLHEDLAP